jgi:hypothetical protein
MVSKQQLRGARPSGGHGRPFADRDPIGKVVLAVVIPAALGALAGWALGVSATGYWASQVIAVVGSVSSGTEHRRAASAAVRGLVSGASYGALILVVHYATGAHQHVSLGSTPGLLVVITAVVGAALTALGARLSR